MRTMETGRRERETLELESMSGPGASAATAATAITAITDERRVARNFSGCVRGVMVAESMPCSFTR
jgi:hypothetical protein